MVALAMGLFLGPEFLLAGGEVDPEPEALASESRVEEEEEALIGIGATAAEGLISVGE